MDPAEYAQQWQDGQHELRKDAAEIAAAGLVTGAAAWLWQNRGRFQGHQHPYRPTNPQQHDGAFQDPIVYVRADQVRHAGRPIIGFGAVIAIALVIAYVVFFIQSF